jgi:hypothetical protein
MAGVPYAYNVVAVILMPVAAMALLHAAAPIEAVVTVRFRLIVEIVLVG